MQPISRRTFLTAGVACIASAAIGGAVGRATATAHGPGDAGIEPRPHPTTSDALRLAQQPDAIARVDTEQPLVALTFDDGPDPRYTPAVLQTLAARGATATFFLVGVNAAAHPDLVAAIVAGGHTIGNHTYDHRELELLAPADVNAEIARGERALQAAGAPRCRWFRPPKGYTDRAVAVLADADRYRTVFWDLCLERFLDHHPADGAVGEMLSRVRPGSILLGHDGGHVLAPGRPYLDRSRTVAALPALLDGLARRGLRAVTVDELVAAAVPVKEAAGARL